MKSILFLDFVAYKAYTADTMRKEALGGSEASLIRVARELAKQNDVAVYQHIDTDREEATIDGVRHIGAGSLTSEPDVVVHFRTGAMMKDMQAEMPNARHIMWTQDFFVGEQSLEGLEGEEVVVLSGAHKRNLTRVAEQYGVKLKAVHTIYNPVEVDAEKQKKVKGRLGFFSSPHKGLDQVVSDFLAIQLKHGGLELVYANPGYIPSLDFKCPDVVNLGQLSHSRVLEEMSKCEVMFYPQRVFAETFGIVLAEANAMGTPVLSHDFGAASEVLMQAGNGVVNCNNPTTIEDTLVRMLQKPQTVKLDERFSVIKVADNWRKLLGE